MIYTVRDKIQAKHFVTDQSIVNIHNNPVLELLAKSCTTQLCNSMADDFFREAYCYGAAAEVRD